jgi:hypothetical protein
VALRRVTPGRLVLASLACSLAVFCIVQDRVAAAGVGRYVVLKRAALAGGGPDVTVDGVMVPAVRTSVARGLAWGGGALAAGLAITALHRRGGPSGPPDPRRGGPSGPPDRP